MSRIKIIACQKCGDQCELLFEPNSPQEEALFFIHSGEIVRSTLPNYEGSYIKHMFKPEQSKTLIGSCDSCEDVDVILILDDGSISKKTLEPKEVWELL